MKGTKYLFFGLILYVISLFLLTLYKNFFIRVLIISLLFFLLFFSMEFMLAGALFNSFFYFNFLSYLKFGFVPGILIVGLFISLKIIQNLLV